MVGKPALASAMKSGRRGAAMFVRRLFRRIERRLDGSPTLVLLDAWSYLQHELF